jgi:hypothetical protein
MTHLSVTLANRWPRCPECQAVAYPAWAVQHRPGCPYTHTNPEEWSTND